MTDGGEVGKRNAARSSGARQSPTWSQSRKLARASGAFVEARSRAPCVRPRDTLSRAPKENVMWSRDSVLAVWMPAVFGLAFLTLSLALPSMWSQPPKWLAPAAAGVGVVLIAGAMIVGLIFARRPSASSVSAGGAGGRAAASGSGSQAYGGKGGLGGAGRGGRGGDALARGNRSVAVGGEGGASSPPLNPR